MRFFRRLVSLGLIGASAVAYLQLSKGFLRGNRVPGEKKLDLDPFQCLELSGEFEVRVLCDSPMFEVKILSDENLLDNVMVENRDGLLKIYLKNRFIKPSDKLIVEIHCAQLQSVSQSGLSKLEVNHINADNFSVNAGIACHIKLSGKANHLQVVNRGVSQINAADFQCQDLKARLEGMSRLSVQVEKEISVTVFGTAQLSYAGNPKLGKTEIFGLGSMERI